MRPDLTTSVIMDFKWPLTQLLPDINLTTRKPSEKYDNLHIGDSLYLRQLGQEDCLHATVLSVVTAPLWYANELTYTDTVGENPPTTPILQYAFNPANRDLPGMLAAMKRAYGESFTEHDNTTFILFQVDPLVQSCGGCGGVKSFDYRPGGDTKPEFYCHTCNHKLAC
jgi:hypothetical protein